MAMAKGFARPNPERSRGRRRESRRPRLCFAEALAKASFVSAKARQARKVLPEIYLGFCVPPSAIARPRARPSLPDKSGFRPDKSVLNLRASDGQGRI